MYSVWIQLDLLKCFIPAVGCQGNQEFSYNTVACNSTCRSLSGPDPLCQRDNAPVEGCGCPEGTHLNLGHTCSPKAECECHYNGGTTPPGPAIIDGQQWWVLTDYFLLQWPHLPFTVLCCKVNTWNKTLFFCSICKDGQLKCSEDCGKYTCIHYSEVMCVQLQQVIALH